MASLTQGKYTTGISSWFSDTEPYRDTFLKASMWLKDKEKISVSPSTSVTFHAAAPAKKAAPLPDERDVQSFQNDADPENAKIAHKGIAIVGSGSNVRALMAYGGGPEGGVAYAQCCNTFAKTLGPGVKVYCMVIPTAINCVLWLLCIVLSLPVYDFVVDKAHAIFGTHVVARQNVALAVRIVVSLLLFVISVSLLIGATNNAFIYTRF